MKLLPSSPLDLIILKGHLLIEEQLRHIIDERVKNPKALRKADLDCHECICLVEAFFPTDFEPWLWPALRKLNKIRNNIAHKVEWPGVNDSLREFVRSFPVGSLDLLSDDQTRFEFTLWSLFEAVSALVEYPSAVVLELRLPGRNEDQT